MISETPRARRRARTTHKLLQVVRTQVGSLGVDGLTMASVAAEMDLTPAALYRYFPNKGAMLAAAVADVLRRQRLELKRIQEHSALASDPLWAIVELAEQQIGLAEREPEAFALMSILLAEPRRLVDNPVEAVHIPELEGILATLARWFEAAANRDELEPGDFRERALILVFGLNGVLQTRKLQRFRPDLVPAKAARALVRSLLVGWGASMDRLPPMQASVLQSGPQTMEIP